MAFKIIWQDKGLLRKFSGDITGHEVLSSNLSILNDKRFENISYVINDFTDIDSFDITRHDVEDFASIDTIASTYNDNLIVIIVATNDGILKGAKQYLEHMKNTSFDCSIVENINDALKKAFSRTGKEARVGVVTYAGIAVHL